MDDVEATQEEADGYAPIRLVFIGPHERGGWAWRREGEQGLSIWKKLRGRVPGGIYTVDAKSAGESSLFVLPATLRYTGENADDAAALQLEARDAEARIALKRLETNTSRTGVIDETLGDLLELAGKLKTYDQRFALAQYVRDQIMKAGKG